MFLLYYSILAQRAFWTLYKPEWSNIPKISFLPRRDDNKDTPQSDE